jgi:hypothetical protein
MKLPQWKQNSPQDQFTAIRSALEGHLSNFQEGIVTVTKFTEQVAKTLEELRILEPFLIGDEPWQVPPYKTIREAKEDGWLLIPSAFPTHHNYYARRGVWKREDDLVHE